MTTPEKPPENPFDPDNPPLSREFILGMQPYYNLHPHKEEIVDFPIGIFASDIHKLRLHSEELVPKIRDFVHRLVDV
jgi:hypothetical protein